MTNKFTPRISILTDYENEIFSSTDIEEIKKIFPENSMCGIEHSFTIDGDKHLYIVEDIVINPISNNTNFNLEIMVYVTAHLVP